MSEQHSILAQAILEAAGEDNILRTDSCLTRLRMDVKDVSKVDLTALRKHPAVYGLHVSGDQVQLILGEEADLVCSALNGLMETKQSPEDSSERKDQSLPDTRREQDENRNLSRTDSSRNREESEKSGGVLSTIKKAGRNFMHCLAGVMLPLLPVLIGAGLLNALLAVINETPGIDTGSEVLQILASAASLPETILPILSAWSAARYFSASEPMSVFLACLMMALSDESAWSGQIIPSIAIAFILSRLEQSLSGMKEVPGKNMIRPLVILLVMIPVVTGVIMPAAELVLRAVRVLLAELISHSRLLFSVLRGALHNYMIIGGIHYALSPIVLTQLAETGKDTFFGSSTFAAVFGLCGALRAVVITSKNPKERSQTAGSLISALLGASEPAVYGPFLDNRVVRMASISAGTLGGLLCGLLPMTSSAAAPTSLFSIALFAGDEFGTFLMMIALSYVTGLMLCLILLKTEKEEKEQSS